MILTLSIALIVVGSAGLLIVGIFALRARPEPKLTVSDEVWQRRVNQPTSSARPQLSTLNPHLIRQ